MSSTEPPKLRSDLLFSRQCREGQTIFVVKDPLNSQYFSLREEEQYLAAQLDGQTPLETIRLRVEERFNVTLSRESLANFVTNLRDNGQLDLQAAQYRQRIGAGLHRRDADHEVHHLHRRR